MYIVFLYLFTFGIFGGMLAGQPIWVGKSRVEITPCVGTPSAGYADRKGAGMEGVLDPLYASALYIDNGVRKFVLCGVDHLGFLSGMVQEIKERIACTEGLEDCEIFIFSSHTHSGGGAYLDIPHIGEVLAGKFSQETREFYIDKTAEAILEAAREKIEAHIGIGYGKIEGISTYGSLWPCDVSLPDALMVLKVTTCDHLPFAVVFNYPLHPTLFKSDNREFSSDFVGCARHEIQSLLGENLLPIFINGAQAEILPRSDISPDPKQACAIIGKKIASEVQRVWEETPTANALEVQTYSYAYTFKPETTPFGLTLPVEKYPSEINLIVLNQTHALLTFPGKLSCLYEKRLRQLSQQLGYGHLSCLGLANDAHGYLISPDAWRQKTKESRLSFGGREYGTFIELTGYSLLKKGAPRGISIKKANDKPNYSPAGKNTR